MPNIESLHEQAVDKAEAAFAMKRKGQSHDAVRLFREALELEQEAAFSYSPTQESEPSRSILFRSAAALAFHAGDYEQAEYLVANGLSGFPPSEIKHELRLLQDEINFRHHISLQGAELTEQQMQMTLWGDATGRGIISADLLVKRIDQIKILFYRTIERLSELPYRAVGKPPKFVTEQYRLFLNALVPSSFGVTFSIGQPIEQLEMFPGFEVKKIEPAQVIDEVITCFELIQQNESDALQERFNDNNYYQNFVAMAKQMAPDGEEIKVLGLAAIRDGTERSIGFRRTKLEIQLGSNSTPENVNSRDREVIRIEGQLKVADSLSTKNETGKVKLVERSGATRTIRVPISQMQDVVQPYFDEYVVITGYRRGHSLYLTDIESGDANTATPIVKSENLNSSKPTLFDES